MDEPIRLVIWDLDETFWGGTLTEGGITYHQANHDIVIELAKRGIISSIVSKNDPEPVRKILIDSGLWDYFVFPSINWEAKGSRIKDIVEASQLRAPTILFIDDNHLNRAEALHCVPGLCVENEEIIPALLDHPLLAGKDDSGLTRLQQYKNLEQKRTAMRTSSDNLAFLRASEIAVDIEFDIEPHIDRAIELINRTNQLNFTKLRLSDDIEKARSTLRAALSRQNVRAGLVKVRDRYGDYGFVGFYLIHLWKLEHFCFSCRTLGMGIEVWLFELFGKPGIHFVGPCATDLFAPHAPIDWITRKSFGEMEEPRTKTGRVLVRGACESQSLAHYIAINNLDVVGEHWNNHSSFLHAMQLGLTPAQKIAARGIGHGQEAFVSRLIDEPDSFDAIILSFWIDAGAALYRHRETGLVLPFLLHGYNNGLDVTKLSEEQLKSHLPNDEVRGHWKTLCREFECVGWSLEPHSGEAISIFEAVMRRLFQAVPSSTPVFFLLACDEFMDPNQVRKPVHHLAKLNNAIRAATSRYANAIPIDIKEAFDRPEDIIDVMHFDRMVYFRLYKNIAARWTQWRAKPAA